MGYYIETPSAHNKAEWIRKHMDAIQLTGCPTSVGEGFVPVCVVDNGPFEAAAIAFDRDEAEAFNHPDGRPREWLLVPVDKVLVVCPHVKNVIKQPW